MEIVRTLVRKHGIAAAVSLFALVLALVAGTWGDRAVFLLFLGGVVVCAYFGGIRPGVIATTVTSICLICQYIMLPADSPRKHLIDFLPSLALFVLIGLLVSYLGWECRFALGELSKWRRGETDLMNQLAEAKRSFEERERDVDGKLAEQQRIEEKLRRERDDLQAEWEAADEKLIAELDELRQRHGQAIQELDKHKQTEQDLRRDLAESLSKQTEADEALGREIEDLRAKRKAAEDRLAQRDADVKKIEEKLRADIAEMQAAKRKVDEELGRQQEVARSLRRELDETCNKYQSELAEWEQAFREADMGRDELKQKLAEVEAAYKENEKQLQDQLAQLLQNRKHSDGRLDQVIDRLRPLAAQKKMAELRKAIELVWVANRLSQSNLPVQMRPVDLGELMDGAVRVAEDRLEAHSQSLTVSLPLTTEWLWGDVVRLEQAIVCLIDFVSRRTRPNGRIEIVAECGSDSLTLRFVEEQAEISADEQDSLALLKIEVGYSPVDSSDDELGFAVARSLLELHGGELGVVTKQNGVGFDVVVQLPLLPKEEPMTTDIPIEESVTEIIGLA